MRPRRGYRRRWRAGSWNVPTCPFCGEPQWMLDEEEEGEGPHRGKGPAALSDEEIKEQLEESLTADSWLDASKMEVEVDEGIVTLRGQAASRQSKRRAEMWADHFMGVRDVRNLLEIENL